MQTSKMAPPRRATIMDVARRSGFSASTVSIVLNEAPLAQHVAAQTKVRIRKAAEALGYRPDVFAQSLRRKRSQTIGVMIFDLSDPYCTLIMRGIERALDPTLYLPILMDAHNERKQFERYLAMLVERRVEGLIVVANWLFSGIEALPEVTHARIPMVVVGRDLSAHSIPSIVVDNEEGGYAALEHLHAIGHRRIAFLRGPRKMDDSSLRWKGARRFARQNDLALDTRLVQQLASSADPASSFEGGLALTERLLEAGNSFSAIMAFDDMTALGALRALYRSGRVVPRDCSLIGFDDTPPALLASPALTTIRQPMEAMGALAVERMLARLGSSGAGEGEMELRTLLAPELVLRESTHQVAPNSPGR